MKYLYIDGDNIGLSIETSFLQNDEASLKSINENINTIIDKLTLYLQEHEYLIIFSGADGIISKGEALTCKAILEYIRKISPNVTFSIGEGDSLKDSYIALRYAKALNKNLAVSYFNDLFQTFK